MNKVPFLSLAIGERFTSAGDRFRKVHKRKAFRLNPNGRGQTHRAIRFKPDQTVGKA